MTTSSIPSRRLNFALALLASALFVGLAYLMLLGAFSRYWSDDFCFLAASQTSPNLWAALQKIYLSWSNRYANMALIGLAQLFVAAAS